MDNWKNKLYFGDNLNILRKYLTDESVDLIYLDPPFNSNATYNVLFQEKSGAKSAAQITAFEDTWEWGQESEFAYEELVKESPKKLADLIQAFRMFLGQNDMMAYLTMMAQRLAELHRVLKPTGSIYLHCDPTASHYLKLLMDAVFEPQNFRNEIVWKRSDAKGDTGQGAKHFGRVNDTILFYAKSDNNLFNPLYGELDADYVESFYRYKDPDGRRYKLDNMLGPGGAAKGNPFYEVMGVSRYWRYSKERMKQLIEAGRVIQTKPGTVPMYKRYLDESKGTPMTTNWSDISHLRGWSNEKLGYPTQKPEALLERIIKASSNEGDVVLDPFCGCGTAIAVAERLHRRWIGIDITHLAITLMRHRLNNAFPKDLSPYEIIGQPRDLESARALARESEHSGRYQFETWATGLVDAFPLHSQKKGADKGIDGYINFFDDNSGKAKTIIVQVKSGHVNASHIRDLKGVLEREKAPIGVYITLEEPTKPMLEEAAAAGFYEPEHWQGNLYPRIQILTIRELLDGKKVEYPRHAPVATFKRAQRQRKSNGEEQNRML
ncbi:MAG: DNA methyltransferase [Dehalococcoidales bacterium]|nr:DNA methyltransferase [Dehalococcoidales bacterium]